jgi:hypothetical protein
MAANMADHRSAARIVFLLIVVRSPSFVMSALYNGTVTTRPRIGNFLGSHCEIPTYWAAPTRFVGQSQSFENTKALI